MPEMECSIFAHSLDGEVMQHWTVKAWGSRRGIAMATFQLHSMKDGARRLGISHWTLRKMAARGEIRVTRIGVRRVLISEEEIVRLIRMGSSGQNQMEEPS